MNITANLPDRYPNDIAVDPIDPSTAYIAIGGFESGHFYKTTNGGTTWSNISETLPDVPGTAVMVDPLNPQNVFIGNDLGIYLSTDAGATWNTFSDGLPEALLVSDLTYSASNRTLRVTTHGNGVFERKLPASLPSAVILSPNGNEYWEGTTAHTIEWTPFLSGLLTLEYSTNDGADWTTIAEHVPSSPSSYTWSTPPITSGLMRVRISAEEAPAFSDISDDPFTVYFNGTIFTTGAGWNLISLPINIIDRSVPAIFPEAISSAFAYQAGYVTSESLLAGKGYWLKLPSSKTSIILGDSLHTDTIAVTEGWNLIGSLTRQISAASIVTDPVDLLESNFFGYAHGYSTVSTIDPGKGYWVRTKASGTIILSENPSQRRENTAHEEWKNCNRLTISDASGTSQALYFSAQASQVNPDHYQLPPLPPKGMFDARYASQRFFESVSGKQSEEYPIILQSPRTPITIAWEISESASAWELLTSSETIVLSGSGSISYRSKEELEKFRLRHKNLSDAIPAQTGLLPNYPNPFNSQTNIKFTIGEKAQIQLRLFDAIGRQIATLYDGVMDPGIYSHSWDAQDLPSGVYFAVLSANNVNYSMKVLLMK